MFPEEFNLQDAGCRILTIQSCVINGEVLRKYGFIEGVVLHMRSQKLVGLGTEGTEERVVVLVIGFLNLEATMLKEKNLQREGGIQY